jgi:copper(I)-binding protein
MATSALLRSCTALVFLSAMGASHDAFAIFIASEPWTKPASRGQTTEAYMELTSTEGATVVGVRCNSAKRVEIQPPGVSAKPVSELALPSGKKMLLAPKAYRIVLRNVGRTLKLGDHVPMVLVVQSADGSRQEIPLEAEVRLHSPTYDHLHGHHH